MKNDCFNQRSALKKNGRVKNGRVKHFFRQLPAASIATRAVSLDSGLKNIQLHPSLKLFIFSQASPHLVECLPIIISWILENMNDC